MEVLPKGSFMSKGVQSIQMWMAVPFPTYRVEYVDGGAQVNHITAYVQ